MKTELVFGEAQKGEMLNAQDIEVLMLHAIDLLKHFNKLTQDRIDELMAYQLPLAA